MEQRRLEISGILARLALHYWRPDFSPQQAKLLIEDMVCDLQGYSAGQVQDACASYRRKVENRFFPRGADIIALMRADMPSRSYLPAYRPPRELGHSATLQTVAEVLRNHGHGSAAESWEASPAKRG